jgi:hypothetical protein
VSPIGLLLVLLALAGFGPVAAPDATATLPPASAGLTAVAEAFVRFARGEADSPPADTPIELLVAGRVAKTIGGAEVLDPANWRICGEFELYAGRTCPFSALDLVASSSRGVVVTSAAPSHPCMHAPPPPSRLTNAYRTVTVTGRGSPTCVDYFAVQLFVNDVGQVVAVNLVMSEP